jgi:UDP-N-acetyl-D-mannosaminuronic acid dehydrogenase
MPQHVAERTQAILASIENPVIAALGLAYKANVDDARESPSVSVIRWLQSAGYEVRSYDPYVRDTPLTGAVASPDEAITGADCLLLLTNHRQFEALIPAEIGKKMRRKILFDTRKALPRADWRNAGFEVYLLGDGKTSV